MQGFLGKKLRTPNTPGVCIRAVAKKKVIDLDGSDHKLCVWSLSDKLFFHMQRFLGKKLTTPTTPRYDLKNGRSKYRNNIVEGFLLFMT